MILPLRGHALWAERATALGAEAAGIVRVRLERNSAGAWLTTAERPKTGVHFAIGNYWAEIQRFTTRTLVLTGTRSILRPWGSIA